VVRPAQPIIRSPSSHALRLRVTGTPGVSNLNYTANRTVPNSAVIPVGSDGKIDLFNGGASAGPIDLIADVTGYFSTNATSAYVPVTPTRLLDTRPAGTLFPGGIIAVNPDSVLLGNSANSGLATGFAVNVTVTGPSGTGFITAYPNGTPVPDTSTLNYVPGLTSANLALVTPGADQNIAFTNGGSSAGGTHLIVDLFGYSGQI
jgi:hypothetical protein